MNSSFMNVLAEVPMEIVAFFFVFVVVVPCVVLRFAVAAFFVVVFVVVKAMSRGAKFVEDT